MLPFGNWCDLFSSNVGAHEVQVLTSRPADLAAARDDIAATIPTHYCSEENIARALRRLGKTAAATLIEEKLPTTKSIRSGDLGEILATEFIAQYTTFAAPIKRLRWKDHRNMAMRGEDVIAILRNPATGALRFLKCEAKSRVTLTAAVVNEARQNLDKNGGLPSPHALLFISARLLETGDDALADAIEDGLLKRSIAINHVRHLIFALSGNSPRQLLEATLNGYAGGAEQGVAGIHVSTHAAFVRDVYTKVIGNA